LASEHWIPPIINFLIRRILIIPKKERKKERERWTFILGYFLSKDNKYKANEQWVQLLGPSYFWVFISWLD
jgi:hypothetical protein